MTKAEYQQRKTAGICCGEACTARATVGTLCDVCRERQRRYRREWASRNRALRLADGLCTWRQCTERATVGQMCQPHREESNKRNSELRRGRYLLRKVAGLCPTCSGVRPSREDAVECGPCSSERAERAKTKWKNAGKKLLRRRSATRRKSRERKIELGLCTNCPTGKAVTETMCEPCRRSRLKNPDAPATPPKREPAPGLSIDEYATARNNWEAA